MKAVGCLVGLCLLAGLVSSEHYGWKVGNTYTYAVKGRLMAGIAEINRQYAGMEMEYNMDIVVIGPNRLNLKPSNFRVIEVNDELEDGGWRDASHLNSQTPFDLPSELRAYLESPIEVEMSKGIVKSIKVQGDLPTWAVNLKRGQVSDFVLDTTGANQVLSGNLNQETNHARPEDASTDSGFFYEVMEETVLGECETYYTVNQAGPFPNQKIEYLRAQGQQQQTEESDDQETQQQQQQKYEYQAAQARYNQNEQDDSTSSSEESQEKHQKYTAYKQLVQNQHESQEQESGNEYSAGVLAPELFHKYCENQHQLYEITKAVNYTACKDKPVLGYVSPAMLYNSRPGDNNAGSILQRMAYSRYVACGKDRKQYTILKIQQEEIYKFGRLSTEKIVGGTVKNLTLLDVQPTTRVPAAPAQPKLIQDLTYTFDPKEQKMRREGDNRIKTAFMFGADEVNENEINEQEQQNQQQASKSYRRNPRSADSQSSEESNESTQNDETQQNQYNTPAERSGFLAMPSMTNPPLLPLLASPLNVEGMKKRVQTLLDEVVQDLMDKAPLAEKETVSKITTMAKIFRYFKYETVEELYHQLADKSQTEEDQIARNIFLDCVAIAGTNPNIKFLIDLVAKKQETGESAAQIVQSFSHYIRTPTQELIKYYYEQLIETTVPAKSQTLQMDPVKSASLLAFGNLLFDACVDTRVMYSRYPVAQYGEFCNHNVVEREYLKPLLEQAQYWVEQVQRENNDSAKHWLTVYMTTLGNIGHPAIVEKVQNWLNDLDDTYSKVKVLFALRRMTISRQSVNIPVGTFAGVDRKNRDIMTDEMIEKNVLPILVAVAQDKTEDFEVRCAAISLLVRSTVADMTLWQKIAYMTWFEKNKQVHSYVYSIIKSLAQAETPVDPVTWRAHQNAKAVFHLMKPIDSDHFGKSSAHYQSEFVHDYQTGFLHHFSYFGAKESWTPNYVHYHSAYTFGNGLGYSPSQINIHSSSLRKLINYFLGKFQRPALSDIQGNDAIQQIVNLLNIAERESDSNPQADIHFRLRNEMERIFSVNYEVIDKLVEQVKLSYWAKLKVGLPINYQKASQLGNIVVEVPTIFGVPATYNMRLSSLISLRGNLKITNEDYLKDVQIQAELHPIHSWKMHTKISFKVPFTGKKYSAGLNVHQVIEFPFRAVLRKSPTGDLQFGITPTHLTENNVNGEIQVFTYHRRPYTAIITDELYPASHKEGGDMKIVHALDKPYESKQTFGENSIGMNFRLEHLSEFRQEREEQSAWIRYLSRFPSPASWLHLGVTSGSPTVRLSERKLILDVSASKTKAIWIMAAGQLRHIEPKNTMSQQSEEQNESNQVQTSEENGSAETQSYNVHNRQQQQQQRSSQKKHQQQQQYAQQQQQQYAQQAKRQQQQQQNQYDSIEEEQDFEGHFSQAVQMETSQDSSELANNNRRVVVVVAIIGKSSPIQSPIKSRGIQKHLERDNFPSTVHFLFSAEHDADNKIFYRLTLGAPAKKAAQQLPQESQAIMNIRDALVNVPLSNIQEPVCVEYNGEYKRPTFANRDDLVIFRQILLKKDLTVNIKGKLSFGRSCDNQEHSISFRGTLERDQEMTEYAKTQSAEAQQCNEDEKRGFYSSNVCLRNSEQQASALNFIDLKFKSTLLPAPLYNVTLKAEQLVRAYFWRYLSYNPVPTSEQQHKLSSDEAFRVQFRMTPDQEFSSLKLWKTNSIQFFENIKTNSYAKALFPITSTQSIVENVRDRAYGLSKSEVSCSIEKSFVSTFDNVTYTFDPEAADNCVHVLAQVSGPASVSVLAENLGTKVVKTTVLLPSNYRIDLLPVPRNQQQTQNEDTNESNSSEEAQSANLKSETERVLVNGKSVPELPVVLRDGENKFIARVEVATDGSLQVFSPVVKVTTNGRSIVIFGSEIMRNSTVGICGDFNGEKSVEFRSPKDCALSSGTLLVASYAFQTVEPKEQRGTCKVNQEIKKAIREEEKDCQSQEFFLPSLYADSSCEEKIINGVSGAVYDTVKAILKRIPFVNSEKWASKARDAVRGLLAGKTLSADGIADILATGIAALLPAGGSLVKPAIRAAVRPIVSKICSATGCCKTLYTF